MIPLFEKYLSASVNIEYLSLADLPTPVIALKKLGGVLGIDQLYLKQDGLSGHLYGGNKIRKLEFILADALAKKVKTVLTFGCVGSNHALACGIYAKQLGLRSISILMPQANATYVRRNLLRSALSGMELCYYPAYDLAMQGAEDQKQICFERDGLWPYVIPFGGSSVLGVIGFVNAAFELAEQIAAGLLPVPDYIYVALGSMGTAVGLSLGLKALGLKTIVKAVPVVGSQFANQTAFLQLFREVNQFLSKADGLFPKLLADNFEIVDGFLGEEYAVFTEKGVAAVMALLDNEGMKIENTYTGKALAALIDQSSTCQDKSVLFWNTSNTHDYSQSIETVNYKVLPNNLHYYFESPVQPLDQDN